MQEYSVAKKKTTFIKVPTCQLAMTGLRDRKGSVQMQCQDLTSIGKRVESETRYKVARSDRFMRVRAL